MKHARCTVHSEWWLHASTTTDAAICTGPGLLQLMLPQVVPVFHHIGICLLCAASMLHMCIYMAHAVHACSSAVFYMARGLPEHFFASNPACCVQLLWLSLTELYLAPGLTDRPLGSVGWLHLVNRHLFRKVAVGLELMCLAW
jgi:hypothetical protein